MIVRRRRTGAALVGLATALGLALVAAQPAAASGDSGVSPLSRSNYAVRAACAKPATGRARCMALQLVARTTEARAHRHPIGLTRAAVLAPSSPPSPAAGDFGLRPQDLHSAYRLPTSASGTQTIALVDAYNDPSAEADLATYSKEFGLPECTAGDGCFEQVNQDGEAASLPFPQTKTILANEETFCVGHEKGESRRKEEERKEACYLVAEAEGWGAEMSLDIETAHAVCQSCHIALVEADSPSYADLETAERAAERLGAGEISNSWAGPECAEGECEEEGSAFDHPGTVITAAAGDGGYLNWLEEPLTPSANFPASSPDVIAVGGTRLKLGPAGEWAGESVWNDGGEREGETEGYGATGGGCSADFEAPPWQRSLTDWSSVGCGNGRAVADVSADADPYTGVAVYDSGAGHECETEYKEGKTTHVLHWCTYGGTSVATPLIASTFALAGGADGVEYPAQTLYESEARSPGSLHDVTEGSNGECRLPFEVETGLSGCTPAEEAKNSCASQAICLAGRGYDGPTGVGTPDGIAAFTRPPTVATETASSIVQATATLNATVDPNGHEVSECKFEYGTGTAYGASTPCSPSPGSGSGPVAVSATLTGLTVNTTYHYRVVATNAGGTSYGSDQTFTTLPYAPTVSTGAASAVTQTSATLSAEVDPNGGDVSECKLEYGTSASYGASAPCISSPGSSSSPVAVSAAITGLSPNTTYHFRIAAHNAGGTSYGSDQTFTTLLEQPTVITGPASSTSQTSVTLSGEVNPNGEEVSYCAFEYGTSSSYGSSAPCSRLPGSGHELVAVSASLTDLSAGATYHYRIVATNAGGASYGSDQTFTTALPTTPEQQTPVQQQVQGQTPPSQGVSPAKESKKPPVPDAQLASTSLIASPSGTVTVHVSCPAAETSCAGTVTLRTLGAIASGGSKKQKAAVLTLAAASFKVAGGRSVTVKLRLSARARALLTREHVLRARASVFARDPAGATHTWQAIVTIRAASTKHTSKA